MPTWRDEIRRCEVCQGEFRPKRHVQNYCKQQCKRSAAYGRERAKAGTKGRRRRRLEASDKRSAIPLPGSVRNSSFSSTKIEASGAPIAAEWGEYVRNQLIAQSDAANPLHVVTPDGRRGRVWLGVGAQCINGQWQGGKEPIIRDARHWGHCICGAIYADKRGTREARKVAKMAAPVFDSYKPNFTETVQGDAYPLKYHEDGYPKLPACLDRSFLSEPLAEAA